MKKIFSIFLGLSFAGFVHSQDRVSTSIPEIGATPIWSITEATGWIKNKEGQWVQGQNKIQLSDASEARKELWAKGKYAMGHDNFYFIEIHDITIDGKHFYVLVKKMLTSDYQYHITGSGSVRPKVLYAVFSKKLETREKTGGTEPFEKFQTSIYYSGELNYTPDYLHQIALGINTVKSPDVTEDSQSRSHFTLWYRLTNDGKNCRFFLDEETNKTDTYFTPVSRLDDLLVSGVENLYYECPKERLQGLLTLLK